MITLVRGARSELPGATARAALDRLPADAVLRMDLRAAFTAPWLMARRLMGAMRVRLGDDVVDQAVAPHRAALSLALRGLRAQLDPQEQRDAAACGAPRVTFAPHAGATPWGSLP